MGAWDGKRKEMAFGHMHAFTAQGDISDFTPRARAALDKTKHGHFATAFKSLIGLWVIA
jgi:hypothetical protein